MNSVWRLNQAVLALNQGGVIAYPTEAVWGLGCDPYNPQAVQRLLQLKQRSPTKGLILVASHFDQLRPFFAGLDTQQYDQLRAGWPGPLTWLVPDNGVAPPWIKGEHATIALRVSAHPTIHSLCEAYGGPIISTSANPVGKSPARTLFNLQKYFAGELDVIVPGALGQSQQPTEIRDLLTGRVMRLG